MKILKENIENKNLGKIIDQDEASRSKLITEAWKGTGFLFGLQGKDMANMAVLMESQKKQILREGATTADMAIFDTIAIPMIRRQNAMMISPNLISVQPLSYPHGLVFYLDYKISDTKKPIQSDYLSTQTATGTTGLGHMDGNTFQTRSGYDQFYNNGNYDISKGKAIPRGWDPNTSALVAADSGFSSSYTATADLTDGSSKGQMAIVDFDLTAMGGITMDQAASLRVYDATGVAKQDVDYYVQRVPMNYTDDIFSTGRGAHGSTTSTDGRVGGPGAPNKVIRLKIIPTRDNLGTLTLKMSFNQYLNLELFPAFSSELKLEIVQVPITTSIHKLKTAWTVELAQDLMSYYAVDAEAELSQLLAEQIAGEKDRMIIRELVLQAGHMEVWNADFYNAVDPNPANTVFRGIESDYNQGLVLAINRIDAKIRKSTKQGGANWVLISAEGSAKLTNLQSYKPTNLDDEGTKFAVGVEKIGTIEQKYNVFVDPNLPGHICLVGRKGTSFFDTGYVYAPYIEYILSPTVIEDQDFNPRKMISSRFGTKMLNNRFYGVVYMQGIGSYEVYQSDLVNNA